ncbi:putative F-box/LRR-repeat protein 14-like [Apostichopus japonicus]|uniref:Putative F-box/LRR-repeat protein 14-like n=1 Tax=Stichopus japonicus TaxID=307972 RepID=A0A2G8JWY3_STIJA|nr:putative F-box/LRR-repeat protein 14-like [Apostichopus japonicus]
MPLDKEHVAFLLPEILAIIFSYLDVADKGRAAQVCRAWRDTLYHRSIWRGVEAKLHLKRSPNTSMFYSLVTRGITKVQILSLRRGLSSILLSMPNIESLNLSGCYNLTDAGLSHAFSRQVTTLTVLNLSLCKQITDKSLRRIAHCFRSLESLDLAGCSSISNMGIMVIEQYLQKLKHLNLRSCRLISDDGISCLAGVFKTISRPPGTRNLKSLILQDCQISDTSLSSIAKGLPNLETLNLSFCCQISDTGMISLSNMSSLKDLNLRSCDHISDLGIAHLAEKGSHFRVLDVSFCDRIGDGALGHIAQGMDDLDSLSLSSCHITDEGLERLVRNLKGLTTLNIGQCVRLTDRGLTLIAENLRKLKCIDLYGCTKITTLGLERIMQLPNLTVLNLGLWHKR